MFNKGGPSGYSGTSEDILQTNPIFQVFENNLQAQLFNSRCHDTGEKLDAEKAKMFRQQLSKINSKKHPNILNLYSMRLGVNSIMKLASLIKYKEYECVNLADNAISEYGIHAIKNLLNNTKINHLNLSSNMISEVSLSMMLEELIANQHLKILDLGILQGSIRKNSLGIDGARCLAALIMQNKVIDTLKLQDNDIGIAGAEILSIALKQNKTLKQFKLAQNLIKTQGAEFILANAINLVSLDLGRNFIKSNIGPSLKNYFYLNKNIRKINLEFNEITAEGVRVLLKGVSKSKLSSLNIRGNSIRDKGVEYIEELFNNQNNDVECIETLEQLDISSNQITPEGMSCISRLLLKSKLKSLSIGKNLIGDEGIIYIAEAIQRFEEEVSNGKLRLNKLDMSSSKISDKGIIKFLSVLDLLPELQHLKASDNFISDKNQKVIIELLNRNTVLITLTLNGNRLSLACLKSIKKIIDKNIKELEQREPNKIKSEIYRLKEKQKKIAQTKERLEAQNREISLLEETKSKLLDSIAKLERDENQKRADYEATIERKREEIDKKNATIKQKKEQLEEEKRNKQKALQEVQEELKDITQKRADLEYQIRVTQEEGRMMENDFKQKTDALKNNLKP